MHRHTHRVLHAVCLINKLLHAADDSEARHAVHNCYEVLPSHHILRAQAPFGATPKRFNDDQACPLKRTSMERLCGMQGPAAHCAPTPYDQMGS